MGTKTPYLPAGFDFVPVEANKRAGLLDVKVKADAAANTWYWYEGSIKGVGNPSCAGCHAQATMYGGHDYVYVQVN